MKNSTMKQRDSASSRGEIKRISMKNKLRIILTSALLLATTSAMAGIIFVPVSGRYITPELASVNVQRLDDGNVRIHTTGLNGELSLRCSDFPPGYEVAASAEGVLPFIQQLDLITDLAEGTVSGHASMDASSSLLAQSAFVRGTASCLPLNGHDCGQLVVDLQLRGALADPNDPTIVGQLRMKLLGNLIWGGGAGGGIWGGGAGGGIWGAMSANATLGGNEALINSAVEYASCRGAL